MDSDRPPQIVVFLGPSLPVERARDLLRAEYRPPAGKGDIYRILTSGVTTIVLIDGIFHGAPSIWQREILAALDEGIAVVGASSMGALRAAELHRFGMIGCGTVFEWYRDGVITGDDEVALQHAPEDLGYRALSEPLVNLRCTLQAARSDGVLSDGETDHLISVLKQTYYPHRSVRAVLDCALVQRWPAPRVAELSHYLQHRAIDLKARDAALALSRCAEGAIAAPSRAAPRPAVDLWSEEFSPASLRFRVVADGDRAIPWPALAEAAWQSPDWPAALRAATARWFLADWARLRGVTCPEDFARAFEARWRAAQRVTCDGDARAWAHARGLTGKELAAQLAGRALAAWLEASGPAAFGIDRDAETCARIDGALAAIARGPAHGTGQSTFLAAWARDAGVRCPGRERVPRWARWGMASAAARREVARRAGVLPRSLRRALVDLAIAEWLVAVGPRGFGRAEDLGIAAVHDLQFTRAIPELLARRRAS